LEAAVEETAFAVEEELLAPTLDLIAFDGALSAAEDGVYATDVVVAFEPADDDPEDAKDEEAPGPDPHEEVSVWIYRS
jgi:hypothetical protein